MENSRTSKAMKNTAIALSEQIVFNVLTFLCRTVFIYTLGKTYLGFSGLFNDILALLSLAEMGIGTAILYSMYEPAARGDHYKVAALLNLYKKIYNSIGIIITIVGLLLTPFLDFFISDIPDLKEIPLIYILYLLKTTTSYFFVYKKSILIVDQKSWIASLIYIITTTAQNVLQIVFLLVTHNFIVYLVIQVAQSLINNWLISHYVDKHYPWLEDFKTATLQKTEKTLIFRNVKAMFFSKVSSAVVTSTDNILISKFVSTVILGLYSNYTLFTTMFKTIVSKIFEALTGSIGNLTAVENPKVVYKRFREIWFLNYLIVSFFAGGLFILINPFIELWIGDSYLLELDVVLIICVNLYMRLIRNTFLTFLDVYGMFEELKIKCVAEALINIVASLGLLIVFDMGIYGILLGTFMSNILTNFWYEPYLLFRKKFDVSIVVYFRLFLIYTMTTVLITGLAYWISVNMFFIGGWIGFAIKLVCICLFIIVMHIVLFHRCEEFKYVQQLIRTKFFKRKVGS